MSDHPTHSPGDESADTRQSEPAPDDPAADKPAVPQSESIRDYLLYTLSLPERALRTTTGVASGAIRESAELLVPQAFQESKTYTVLVKQTLEFLTRDVGGVAHPRVNSAAEPAVDNYIARKTVGNFIEMAGLATLHLSPMMLLAVVSDVAYGTQTYLHELSDELKREGVIAEDSTIDHAGDLLDAVSRASGVAASAFDAPPISVDGLRDMIEQTSSAVSEVDPTQILPQAEVQRMWNEMREIADREEVHLLDVSSAMALHSLDRVATLGRGALSTARAAGRLLDKHVLDHYRTALTELEEQGYYQTLAKTSQPYIEAVWLNFSSDKSTITEDLLSGKLVGEAADSVKRWLGLG